MIPDSLAPGIVIREPDKTSARESGDEATFPEIKRVARNIQKAINRYVCDYILSRISHPF